MVKRSHRGTGLASGKRYATCEEGVRTRRTAKVARDGMHTMIAAWGFHNGPLLIPILPAICVRNRLH